MASLAASDASPVVVDASPAVVDATAGHPALPARSATNVRIAGLAVLCAATLVAPALLLVWMPIVLGVPHIASDVRYLVVPLPRRQVVVALAACAALVGLKAASIASGMSLLRAEMVIVAMWLLAALALDRPLRSQTLDRHAHMVSRPATNDRRRSQTIWFVAALAALVIVALPMQFAIAAAFAHNVVAIVAWAVVRRPSRRHFLAVLAAIGAALVLLVALGPALATFTGGNATRWLTVDRAASLMFGGVPLPIARALVIAFAFLQAVHYAIWLDWIPRRNGGPLRTPYRHCSNGLREDGLWRTLYRHCSNGLRARGPLLVVAATTLVVIGAAFVDAAWTRTTYLALATFHIYLELVILGAMFARRRA